MKKITAMMFTVIMLGALLSGCYSKSCPHDQMSYKDSGKMMSNGNGKNTSAN